MRVALVRALPGKPSLYTRSYGLVVPPLGLASLAGAVRDLANVKIFDAEAARAGPRRLLSALEDFDPDVVGFTLNSSTYHDAVVSLAKGVKERLKGAVVVAGGHHATFTYPLLLRSGVDYVVLGEGEQTFRELVAELKSGGDPRSVKGVAYLCGEREACASWRRPVESLDELPMPAYDLLNRDLYKVEVFGEGSRLAALETSRGCPFNCDFCSVTVFWGGKWRLKGRERVLRELDLVASMGYDWVFFVDDNFILPSRLGERLKLLDKIAEKFSKLSYIVQLRADVASNPEVADKLRDAGVKLVFLGIESGDEEVLRAMKKSSSVSASERAVEELSKRGIVVLGGVVIGAPYESRKARRATYELAWKLAKKGLDALQVSIYTPLPGTRSFYAALAEGKLATLAWRFYDCMTPVAKVSERAWRLYFESRAKAYAFYLKKWLASRLGKTEKFVKPLAGKAAKYFARNLPKYLLALLTLPLRSFFVPLVAKFSSPKLSDEEKELLFKAYEFVRSAQLAEVLGRPLLEALGRAALGPSAAPA